MRPLASYINNAPKCEPRPSAIHGFGLFAKADIAAGESFMTLSEGNIVAASTYLGNAGGLREDEWNALSENQLLVRSARTYYYFINHQLRSNARVDISRKCVVARIAIRAHAEITLNYLEEPLPKLYFETCDVSHLLPGLPTEKDPGMLGEPKSFLSPVRSSRQM